MAALKSVYATNKSNAKSPRTLFQTQNNLVHYLLMFYLYKFPLLWPLVAPTTLPSLPATFCFTLPIANHWNITSCNRTTHSASSNSSVSEMRWLPCGFLIFFFFFRIWLSFMNSLNKVVCKPLSVAVS